jgi:glycosyltransferase involved in cell wall biosynthesis
MVGIHQSAHVRALAERVEQVDFVAEQEISTHRRSMGWLRGDLGRAILQYATTRSEVAEVLKKMAPSTVHIISGLRGYRIGRWALEYAVASGLHVGMLVEGADPSGLKGLLRRLSYQLEAAGLKSKVQFVLAMGSNGTSWYRACGFPPEKLFAYAYFTESPRTQELVRGDGGRCFQIVYIGQCIGRKNVRLLMRALGELEGLPWRLRIVGDGAERAELQRESTVRGYSDRVEFIPFVPMEEAMGYLRRSDLLVLPSRFDGWGAVVNEALMSGVPVVCSDSCGARDLIGANWRGTVFRSNDAEALKLALAERISTGSPTTEQRERLIRWSQCITGAAGSEYLLQVLQHVYSCEDRPEPPWTSEPKAPK